MDQSDQHQNLHTLSQFTRYQFLKKITQLLLSVSVISLLLSYSHRLSFLYSFNFYLSTVPVKLFTHTVDKNSMFLLCNGLLVFVAKFSGLISSWRNNRNSIESLKDYDLADHVSLSESKVLLLEEEVVEENIDEEAQGNDVMEERRENDEYVIEQDGEDRETEEDLIVDDEGEEERENGSSIVGEEAKENEVFVEEYYESDNQGQIVLYDDDDDELLIQEDEEDEEGHGLLSTEELNKKFEEFIRKMKEEIRIEAQQQLVMVN